MGKITYNAYSGLRSTYPEHLGKAMLLAWLLLGQCGRKKSLSPLLYIRPNQQRPDSTSYSYVLLVALIQSPSIWTGVEIIVDIFFVRLRDIRRRPKHVTLHT